MNRAAAVWLRRLTPVRVGTGGLIARGASWARRSVSADVEGLCICVAPPSFVVPSSTSTVGPPLV